MNDTFEDYDEDRWFWFVAYLRLGAAICKDPSISVKNSSFKDTLDQLSESVGRWERTMNGSNTYGTK